MDASAGVDPAPEAPRDQLASAPEEAAPEAAPSLPPEEVDALLEQVRAAEELHDFDAADTILADALGRSPNEPRLLAARRRVEVSREAIVAGHWIGQLEEDTGALVMSVPGKTVLPSLDGAVVVLRVRCEAGTLSMYIESVPPSSWHAHEAKARISLDDKATKTALSRDGTRLELDRPGEWLTGMVDAESLSIRVQPLYAKPVSYSFDVRGARRVAEQLRTACPAPRRESP